MSDFTNSNETTNTNATNGLLSWVGLAAAYIGMIGMGMAVAEWARRTAFQMDIARFLDAGTSVFGQLALLGAFSVLLFLAFQWLSRKAHLWMASVAMRAAMAVAAAFIAFGAGMFLLPAQAQPHLAYMVGGGLVLVLVFDFFTENASTNFGWTVMALMLFSAFSAWILWSQTVSIDREKRAIYADYLANARDTLYAEPAFVQLETALRADRQLPLLLKPWPIKPSTDSVRNYLSKLMFGQQYLFHHYQVRLFAFDRNEEAPLLLDQSEKRSAVLAEWDAAQPLSAHPGLRSGYGPGGAHRYLLQTVVNRMQDANHPVELYAFFDQIYPAPSQVYAALFNQQAFKGMKDLNRYHFAVMNGPRLVAEQGAVGAAAFQLAPEPGQTNVVVAEGLETTVSRSADGKLTAAVGRPEFGWLKAVYLFALLFTFASALLLVLGLLTNYLPFNATLLPSARGSLGRRLHLSYLGLLAVGFMVIGWTTYSHFSETARETEQKNAESRAQSALAHVRIAAVALQPGSDSVGASLGPKLADFAHSLNIDANLYDAEGRLVYSTREDLRRIGQLNPVLPAAVQRQLAQSGAPVETTETMQQQPVPVKFLPVTNGLRQNVAFIGLPYRPQDARVDADLSDFIGMLAGIYVFLLLVAAGITYVLANSITGPLKSVAAKIKEVQLQDKNQPIDYRGDAADEIGGLVQEYNRMVDKLEDSKQVLVKFERESAWRDMARQIAHDIKNPLTTMKLTMQQLERVANDPDQAAAYLKKATGRLIEQIDSLAQTASEFSMFASLDRTPKNPVVINDLVESVFDLFTEQKDAVLTLDLPDEKYVVRADKNHLLRVLNNLVINAIQAIPSDRKGHIRVALRNENGLAVIRIRDNGGGIPVEIRDRVFEPNFTTKTSGSGLGLAICKKIIEAHDGDIRFETKDNEGTEFFVELPIVNESLLS